ncbi:hypothetical protein Syun_004229 [Stephania yunnanensis]|uniref:Uncharacterized protein n=1 Tax=Stephania yunnanensis TaxID=152371 RepID=A0AAP0Q0K5_9MAGN
MVFQPIKACRVSEKIPQGQSDAATWAFKSNSTSTRRRDQSGVTTLAEDPRHQRSNFSSFQTPSIGLGMRNATTLAYSRELRFSSLSHWVPRGGVSLAQTRQYKGFSQSWKRHMALSHHSHNGTHSFSANHAATNQSGDRDGRITAGHVAATQKNSESRNISSSTDQKLDRMISMMEHLLSSGKVQVNPAMDSSYSHNYGRYENSHYNNVNGVGSKDLVTNLDQYSATLHRTIDEAELCSTQPTFNPDEDVSVHTLKNLEVHEDIQMEDYLIETSNECEVFQIEPEIVIALNEGEDEMNIDVNSDKPEKPQIESEEDQLLVLVQPPTLPCTFGKPYKGVEVRERLQIFYTADTFVLDDPDTIDSFVLEVPDELLNLKEGMHVSLPN